MGSGEAWMGGDIANFPGGGQKIRLLKDALEPFADDHETLILFSDRWDISNYFASSLIPYFDDDGFLLDEEEEEKFALFMKRIINSQQMIR